MDKPTARDILSEGVIAIDKDATINEASRKMKDNGVRSLVVVSGKEVVGLIVGRDIIYNVIAVDKNPSTLKVKEIMSEDLVTASPEDTAEDIAIAMIRNNISRLPVLEGDRLLGIITQEDILRAWPGYIELLEEEAKLSSETSDYFQGVDKTFSGECDSCSNYSEELVEKGGRMLCPECLSNV